MIESRIGPMDLDTAVEGYLRYSESLRHDDPDDASDLEEADETAWDALETAIRRAPADVAWGLVVTLLRRAPDERLEVYAAGPLEELVVHRAVDVIDQIEAESMRDARFRWALGCVWVAEDALPAEILARVVAASGGAIKPFRRSGKRTRGSGR